MGNAACEPDIEQNVPLISKSKSIKKKAAKKQPLILRESNFKVSIAIDFGTDGCGIAFAYEGKVTIYNQWRGHQANSTKRAKTKTKTKTQLILNDKNKVTCFGNAAKFMYYNFEEEERETKKFFEKFKMALYEEKIGRIQDIIEADEKKERDDITTDAYLRAADGQQVLAEIVFIAAFQTLQEKAKAFILHNIMTENQQLHDDEIQYICTVPAIWSQKAKNNMREWIIEAGLVNRNILNQCVIVYEPDCASLSIQKQYFRDEYQPSSSQSSFAQHCNPTDDQITYDYNPKKEHIFEEDDKYIIIDAGGGTVDVACHKILSDGSVEEIVYPTGGKWGSTYIDELFITLLEDIFGVHFVRNYKQRNPANFVELMEQFEKAKKTFYNRKNEKNVTHRVQLSNDFMGSLYEKYDKLNQNPQQIMNQYAASHKFKCYKQLFDCETDNKDTEDDEYQEECDESSCVLRIVKERADDEDEDEYEYDEEQDDYQYIKYLEMDVKIWKCLFDSKINPIISHVVQLLKMEALKYCKYLGLVGGFAASKYFQHKMRNKFSWGKDYSMNVIVPRFPMLSVVEGAAYMAITQDYIRARKLPFTYGVCLGIPQSQAIKYGLTENYIKMNLCSDGFVNGKFFILGRINERVGVNEVRTKESFRQKHQKHSTVPIYRSSKLNPVTKDDAQHICNMKPQHFDKNPACITEFHFYGTMLKVFSYAKSTPEQKKTMIIDFNINL